MRKYAVVFQYANQDKISQVRPRHREYLSDLLDQKKLVTAGPFEDDSGALIVYQGETAEEVEWIIKNDPFYQVGVFADYTIKPWKQALP